MSFFTQNPHHIEAFKKYFGAKNEVETNDKQTEESRSPIDDEQDSSFRDVPQADLQRS